MNLGYIKLSFEVVPDRKMELPAREWKEVLRELESPWQAIDQVNETGTIR